MTSIPLTSCQVVSLRMFLYCNRYRSPGAVLHVTVALVPDLTTPIMTGQAITLTAIVSAALRTGEPLSVTRTVRFVTNEKPVAGGVQLNTPVVGLIAAPEGPPGSRLNVRALPSASDATAVKVRLVPSPMNLLPMDARTGARLKTMGVVLSLGVLTRNTLVWGLGLPLFNASTYRPALLKVCSKSPPRPAPLRLLSVGPYKYHCPFSPTVRPSK